MIELKKAERNNYTSTIQIDEENDRVIKIIDYENFSQELFEREIYWLSKLAYSGIAPNLIDYNIDTYTITMNWCGNVLSNINKPKNMYEQLYNINIILLQNGCLYNDWKYGNFLVKNDKITIIDFGWCPKIKEDYTCNLNVNSILTEKPSGNFFEDILEEGAK